MKNREIVINKCWGGFGLSHKAIMLYAKLSGFKLYPFVEIREKRGEKWSPTTGKYKPYINEKSKDNSCDLIHYFRKPLKNGVYENNAYFSDRDIERDDLMLIKVIKTLGSKSSDRLANLKIVKIPADIERKINDYDDMESVEEKHTS